MILIAAGLATTHKESKQEGHVASNKILSAHLELLVNSQVQARACHTGPRHFTQQVAHEKSAC